MEVPMIDLCFDCRASRTPTYNADGDMDFCCACCDCFGCEHLHECEKQCEDDRK